MSNLLSELLDCLDTNISIERFSVLGIYNGFPIMTDLFFQQKSEQVYRPKVDRPTMTNDNLKR